ncbi:MBL fold metallo-hydrolase [Sphingomonas sp. KR1UV-12]|uniref:MBL fold metallo-hydrolase n=1 Tax=Sphingomonas aurea TaxID=3063994 RepID=A0ABT9EPQ3_9SPHN|nr:MBL fold metallo-hydrolase [Sphingomonas sp. KR1UV-12]MDP1028807.1 MBL fold metallo-hydrolase [Sphingomonas sp. KR1UV-12]
MRQVADNVWCVTAGGFPANSYICRTDVPGDAFLVDVGLDPEPIAAALQILNCRPAHLFCTHGHFDHIGSARYFQERYGAEVHLHTADVKIARTNNFILMVMKREDRISLPPLSLVEDGASFRFGDRTLIYRSTPGHTPGSCSLVWGDQLFTGDTLFTQGVGLSKLPGENPAQLRSTIRSLWGFLDNVIVHPGHGPSAPGMIVKRDNAALRAFLAEDATVLDNCDV